MRPQIGNRVSELEVRQWLDANNYVGKTAVFDELELHAIQRPGWLQIFRFKVHATNQTDERETLFGAMRSDERYGGPKIMVSREVADRDSQLDEWSDGLIVHRSRRPRK